MKSSSVRLKRFAVSVILGGLLVLFMQGQALVAQQAALSWNPSTDTNAVGYVIYYGGSSQTYTNTVVLGNVTTTTISGLTAGATYYFAATAYNSAGDESSFSTEVSYAVPQSASTSAQPPTLNSIPNLTLNENATVQPVNLSGITSGDTNQTQTLTVTASSSNPSLIPIPAVSYPSPGTTGSLYLVLTANAVGSAIITVTVNNGSSSNNLVSQSFTVTVNPVPTLNPITNLALNVNAAAQTVNLSGISSGAASQNLTLTVTATSSNPSLIPAPNVKYSSPSATGSLILQPVTNGVGSATITVTVINGGAGSNLVSQSFTVTVASSNGPQVTKPLTNIVALAGQNVTLSVTASGQATLQYSWKHNGSTITGSSSSLTINSVSTASTGTYSVTVSNSVGTATSTASLTVSATAAANLTQAGQSAGGTFSFTVTGITGYQYAVQATTDMVHWTSLVTNTAPFVFTDTNSSQYSQRYYRTLSLQ